MANAMIVWPVRFAAASYVLRATVNGVTADLPFPATGSLSGDYYMSGDGSATDLLQVLTECLEAHSEGPDFTITLSSFRVLVTCLTDNFQLLWAHANTTLNEAVYGFNNASAPLSSPGTSTIGDLLPMGLWRPRRPISMDSRDRQPTIGGIARAVSGLQRTSRLALPLKERDIGFQMVLKEYVLEESELASEPSGSFEAAWLQSLSYGRVFRLCPDEASISTYTTYRMREIEDPIDRETDFPTYWNIDLMMARAT